MKNVLIAATIAVCATAAGAQDLTVEGETGVTYTVLEVSSEAGAVTRRNADGANTYTEHQVSCDPYRIGLVASGPTLDSLNENPVSDPEMVEIIRGSAEDKIAAYACAN
ncbi:hypothetical protein MWU61_09890 [Loktanella sp. F6476L]|uniref:hypothetical protein n=1 Tax=Loktanella sp. F6476L TaxID=2926405 RepID=UPI001FF1E79F|nr:hypothetical protein [Loktanella sp. F6476L]MCK0120852.1 hypothetical protein [Loktanella sp. F6476L]